MPSASSAYKVEGGKLVKIKVGFGSKIERLQILGDFFLYPEDSLDMLEKAVEGMGSETAENELEIAIEKAAKDNGIEMVGINPQAIAKAIRMAIGSAKHD